MYIYMYVQKDFKLKGRLPIPPPPKKNSVILVN